MRTARAFEVAESRHAEIDVQEYKPSDQQLLDGGGSVAFSVSPPFENVREMVAAAALPRRPNRNRPIHRTSWPAVYEEIQQLMPSRERLEQLAKESPPRQEWLNEEIIP